MSRPPRIGLLSSALLFGGCTPPDLDDYHFACLRDRDCVEGYICGLDPKVCVSPTCATFTSHFEDGLEGDAWALVQGAHEIDGRVRLTELREDDRGMVWYRRPQPADTFTFEMEFEIANGNGADGMTMAWVDAPAEEADGGRVFNLGAYMLDGYVVELDTFTNGWLEKPAPHVSLGYGMKMEDFTAMSAIATSAPLAPFRNNGPHTLKLVFDLGRASIDLDGVPVLSADIPNYEPREATFGATAATGALFDNHDVLRLKLSCE